MDAIRMMGIVKCFGPVRANDGIDLIVKQQEIHCLLGENGTGKSTLMNILFGLYHPDAGEIYINEKKASVTNPNDAYALGIGMVHQHFMLVNQLTVLENIILGKESGGFLLNRKESRKKVEELVERFGFRLPLDEKVENLSVGMKQRVEILKTLYRGADIIILDEPTAVLTPQEVEELFKILRQLKKNGKTIIFITHKLNETMSLSDRITVIRKGKVVFNCDTCDTNEKELATQMVGRQVESIVTKAEDPHDAHRFLCRCRWFLFYWFCTGRSCDFRCFRCSNGLDLWSVLSEMESPAVCSWCRCKPVCKRHYSRYVKGNLEYRGNERFCTVYL